MTTSRRAQTGCLVSIGLLCALTIGFSSFVLLSWKAEQDTNVHAKIHLIVNDTQLSECPKPEKRTILHLPCWVLPYEYVTKGEGGIGPLKCADDFYDKEGGRSFCGTGRDTFHLNGEKNAVVVQRPGIYRIYGQVAFKDNHKQSVLAILRISGISFIECHHQNTNTGHSPPDAPHNTCTLNGERRLREGDKVDLFLPQMNRTINCYGKTTFWGIARVG